MSSYAVNGSGFSPYDVLAFVQEHAQETAGLVRREMHEAQDRNSLAREVSDLAAGLSHCKDQKDWTAARDMAEDFMKKHPELVGTSNDLTEFCCNADAWSKGAALDQGSYSQTNWNNGAPWGANFEATWTTHSMTDDDRTSAQNIIQQTVDKLNGWKDEIAGDDKLAIMTLTQDAEDLKNIYSVGSNLQASGNQTAQAMIQNMKG